jgi:hypothetical protein
MKSPYASWLVSLLLCGPYVGAGHVEGKLPSAQNPEPRFVGTIASRRQRDAFVDFLLSNEGKTVFVDITLSPAQAKYLKKRTESVDFNERELMQSLGSGERSVWYIPIAGQPIESNINSYLDIWLPSGSQYSPVNISARRVRGLLTLLSPVTWSKGQTFRAVFLLVPAELAQTSPGGGTPVTGETRYFLRLFNCDDYCSADLNGNFLDMIGFSADSNWLDLTEGLQEGRNRIKLSVNNQTGAIAYGFQIRKNESVVFEQICGRVGIMGCDNNRNFPTGIAREFSYEVRMSPGEARPAHERWLSFITAFRQAVDKRDRTALRGMIASPFVTSADEVINSPAKVIRWFDNNKLWQELQRETASGSTRFTFNKERPTRCLLTFCFELGTDGRWRLSGQGENA